MCMQHFQSHTGVHLQKEKATKRYLWKEDEKDSCTTEVGVVAGGVIRLAVFWAAVAGWCAEACGAGAEAELVDTGACSTGILIRVELNKTGSILKRCIFKCRAWNLCLQLNLQT